MKRLFFLGLLMGMVGGYLIGTGTAVSPSKPVLAQQAATTTPPLPPKAYHWSREALEKLHTDLAAIVAKGQRPVTTDFITLPPGWRFNHRFPGDNPDGSESHEKVTDFFIIVAGSGTVGVGGEIVNPRPVLDANGVPVPGEFRGWPVKNGTTYRVKAGDWVHLPPHTTHWANGDKGGMTFMVAKAYH